MFPATDFKAWEFNYVKNQDPLFAICDILLVDSDERCGLNETNINDRESKITDLVKYWKDK